MSLDIEQVEMFEIAKTAQVKVDHDSNHLTVCHSKWPVLPFIFLLQKMRLNFSFKFQTEVIQIAKKNTSKINLITGKKRLILI